MNQKEIREKSKSIHGSLTEGDISIILDFSSKVKENGLIVEIGCYYGKSSSLFYWSKDSSVDFYTIDSFTGTEVDKSPDQYRTMIDNMSNNHFYPKIIFSDSSKASYIFNDNSVDLLFIDGGHNEETVTADIRSFLPKMKKGSGIMFGHDWGTYEGVSKSVWKFFKPGEIKTNLSKGSSIWEARIQ